MTFLFSFFSAFTFFRNLVLAYGALQNSDPDSPIPIHMLKMFLKPTISWETVNCWIRHTRAQRNNVFLRTITKQISCIFYLFAWKHSKILDNNVLKGKLKQSTWLTAQLIREVKQLVSCSFFKNLWMKPGKVVHNHNCDWNEHSFQAPQHQDLY